MVGTRWVGASLMSEHPCRLSEMVAKRTKRGAGKAHRFGGDWTTAKLEVLASYLSGYTKVLKDKPSRERPFRKAYIDAFAGTGYREARRDSEGSESSQTSLLLPDLAAREQQGLLDGSARQALKVEPRFDRYVFIERSAERCAQLQALKVEFPHLAEDILIRHGDANAEIQALCQKDWRSSRAVLFLDPYGMQVEWKTIEAIAGTRAIDLWLLFPLGIGVNRLLTRSGEIPESWRKRLDLLLGTESWYDELYRVEREHTLFGEADHVVKATTETIGRYFNQRLKTVFKNVAEKPRVLRNSANCPCTCSASPSGTRRARPSRCGSRTIC